MQGDPPLHGQAQKQQKCQLRRMATEPIDPGLNAVLDLIDFMSEEADDLRSLGVGEVAGSQPQRLPVQSPPQAGRGLQRDTRAQRFRPPQAQSANRRDGDADQHQERQTLDIFPEPREAAVGEREDRAQHGHIVLAQNGGTKARFFLLNPGNGRCDATASRRDSVGGRFRVDFLRKERAIAEGFALFDQPAPRLEELGNQENVHQQQAQRQGCENAPDQRLQGLTPKEVPSGKDPLERIELRGYHQSCRSSALTCPP